MAHPALEPVIDAAQAQWPDIRKVTEGNAREWLRSLIDENAAHTLSQRFGALP